MPFKFFSLLLCAGLLAQKQPSLDDHLKQGNQFFAAGKLAEAVAPYQKAFEMDRQNHKLDPPTWKALIDHLALSYGAVGKLTAEEEVLQYGITQDASNPLFYYRLANVYAGRNDRVATMKYLRLALENKPNGELPDPRKDESFVRFYKNDELRKLVNSF